MKYMTVPDRDETYVLGADSEGTDPLYEALLDAAAIDIQDRDVDALNHLKNIDKESNETNLYYEISENVDYSDEMRGCAIFLCFVREKGRTVNFSENHQALINAFFSIYPHSPNPKLQKEWDDIISAFSGDDRVYLKDKKPE